MKRNFKCSIVFILKDVEKRGNDSDDSDESDNDEEVDKQMGETEEGADK